MTEGKGGTSVADNITSSHGYGGPPAVGELGGGSWSAERFMDAVVGVVLQLLEFLRLSGSTTVDSAMVRAAVTSALFPGAHQVVSDQ